MLRPFGVFGKEPQPYKETHVLRKARSFLAVLAMANAVGLYEHTAATFDASTRAMNESDVEAFYAEREVVDYNAGAAVANGLMLIGLGIGASMAGSRRARLLQHQKTWAPTEEMVVNSSHVIRGPNSMSTPFSGEVKQVIGINHWATDNVAISQYPSLTDGIESISTIPGVEARLFQTENNTPQ